MAPTETIYMATHQPWLKNKIWRDGHVRDSQLREASSLWFAFLLTTLFSLVLTEPILRSAELREGFFLLFALFLPLFSLILFTWALYRTLHLLKYGRSTLQLVTFPGVIGGQFIAVLYTQKKLADTHHIRAKLACIHETVSGVGRTKSTHRTVIWSDELRLARTADENHPTRTAIPVAFTIPNAARPTDQFERHDRIFWKLTATAEEPGIDFAASFEVPIYITPDSGKNRTPAVDPIAPYRELQP